MSKLSVVLHKIVDAIGFSPTEKQGLHTLLDEAFVGGVAALAGGANVAGIAKDELHSLVIPIVESAAAHLSAHLTNYVDQRLSGAVEPATIPPLVTAKPDPSLIVSVPDNMAPGPLSTSEAASADAMTTAEAATAPATSSEAYNPPPVETSAPPATTAEPAPPPPSEWLFNPMTGEPLAHPFG